MITAIVDLNDEIGHCENVPSSIAKTWVTVRGIRAIESATVRSLLLESDRASKAIGKKRREKMKRDHQDFVLVDR